MSDHDTADAHAPVPITLPEWADHQSSEADRLKETDETKVKLSRVGWNSWPAYIWRGTARRSRPVRDDRLHREPHEEGQPGTIKVSAAGRAYGKQFK